MTDYLIRLPWPPKGLQPHAKGHWRPKAKATKEYRATATLMARNAGLKDATAIPDADMHFEFYPPDKRRRDAQNMPAQMKAAIDGIADAMGCDDNQFSVYFAPEFLEPVVGGSVLVLVRPNSGIKRIPFGGVVS